MAAESVDPPAAATAVSRQAKLHLFWNPKKFHRNFGSKFQIVSHSFTPISSGLWSPTKKYLEYSKCFLFKQALVLVCLTDRPHIKSKTIKGVFSNTGIALCVSNLWFLFILWSLQHKETIFGFRKKNLETIFFIWFHCPFWIGRAHAACYLWNYQWM